MKHFEELWEESESVIKNIYQDMSTDDFIYKIEIILNKIKSANDHNMKFSLIGELLFYISGISNNENINTYTALKEAIDSAKIEYLDPHP